MSPLDLLAWVGAVCGSVAILAITFAIVRGVIKGEAKPKTHLTVVNPSGVMPTGKTPPGGVRR